MPNDRVKGQMYVGRRGLLGRKQWFGRIVSARNGKVLLRTAEGYNNRDECEDALDICVPDIAVEYLDTPDAV